MLMTIILYFGFFLSLVGVLLGVAFFTLMERKVMGLSHFRKGPNKVAILGVSQPISDAAKLLTKENLKLKFNKIMFFSSGPLVGLIIMGLCWITFESQFQMLSKSMVAIMVIFSIMSLTPYLFILMGWGSNSKYALMGSMRAIAQVVSYEVCLVILLLNIMYYSKSFKLSEVSILQSSMWFMWMNLPLFFTWVMLCMAESNRTPFDHAESESELVSGFNVEYGGGLFAVIFVSEYGMIMFMSFFTSIMFMGQESLILKTFMVCFVFVWVRCCFPRVRYDKLMMMCWKICLPYSLCLLCIYMM